MTTEVQTQPPSVIQRPLRGSRISTFYPVKSLPALSSLDSAFQLQEYISLLIRLDVHDVEAITSLPGVNRDAKDKESGGSREKEGKSNEEGKEGSSGSSAEGEKGGEEKDVTVDEACWIYEQLRRLAQDLTHPLITTLQQECSRTTCPEMKAGEWLYLCVAHGTEGAMEQCCAIDYILHTLDSATALLNSPRAFPSRLQIPPSSCRHFSSLARRLGRIFAHAYFHHREAFEQAEAESSLYARFLSLTAKFDLVPSEFLVIPATAGPSSGGGGNSSDEEEDGGRGGSGGGFGLREVKLGTSYDPRRSQAHGGPGSGAQQQHQLPSSFQDEFPDVPRTRRLPQQYQQYSPHSHLQQHVHQSQQSQVLAQPIQGLEPPTLGTESPTKKPGRNRTHTMVLSEAANIVDDLAKAAAAAAKAEEEEKERLEKEKDLEEKEKQAKAREEAEREEREKAEAEAKAKQEQEVREEEAKEGGEDEELAGEGTDEVSREETAVEELLADKSHQEQQTETKPAVEDDKISPSPEDEPATKTDEDSAAREVDIVEGATAADGGLSTPAEQDAMNTNVASNEDEEDKTTTEVKLEPAVETSVGEGAEADVAEGKDAGDESEPKAVDEDEKAAS